MGDRDVSGVFESFRTLPLRPVLLPNLSGGRTAERDAAVARRLQAALQARRIFGSPSRSGASAPPSVGNVQQHSKRIASVLTSRTGLLLSRACAFCVMSA